MRTGGEPAMSGPGMDGRPAPDLTSGDVGPVDAEWGSFTQTLGSHVPDVVFASTQLLGDSPFFVTDDTGGIIWANAAFTRFTGYTLEEVRGRRRMDLSQGPVTPQQQRLAAELAALHAVSAEFPVRDGTGASRWIALSAVPVRDTRGRAIGLIGIERDISGHREVRDRRHQALRRAESLTVALEHEKRLLGLVIGTIPHMVWWKGPDLRFTDCNEAYLRLRGLRDRVEVVGLREDQLPVADDLGDRLAEMERSVLDSGDPLLHVKLTSANPPGAFQFSVQPFLDGGQIVGVVGVGADITHATELERQLAQANRLEAIGQLAAGIAHEINTPVQYASDNTRFVNDSVCEILSSLRELERLADDGDLGADELRERLRGVVAGLDLEFVSEEVPNALAQSLEGLDRVTQIVRAMKDFSHPGQGRADADLNRLVSSTAQVSRNEWKYVAQLELDLDPRAGTVSCFEGDLKQVVLNMVVNAAHAIDERRRLQNLDSLGTIVVATRRLGEEVRITITDDGIGMEEDTLQRVFDPFFTTKEVGKGTGQGLTLARSAVKKHGGRIEITSKPGEGSTFSIVLPVHDPGAAGPVVGAGGVAGAAAATGGSVDSGGGR